MFDIVAFSFPVFLRLQIFCNPFGTTYSISISLFLCTGCGLAFAIMEEIMALLAPINATQVIPNGGGADVGMWDGVPKGSLYCANEKYFHYHHSNGKFNFKMLCKS